ncbi:MAG: BREX system ATP-binding domain-containing protein, partial [Vicinamibacteria bacterium]
NPRAVQIRLPSFDLERLELVGRRIRDLYSDHSSRGDRIHARADDPYIAELARAVTGGLGGRVGVAPRIFLKKLVSDVLDRIDQFEDFDPRRDYALTFSDAELSAVERAARRETSASDLDEIELEP